MEEPQKDAKYPRIVPRSITGSCNVRNKGALDWSPCGLLAYGSNFTVVVVDSIQLQTIQTLDRHKAPVVKVKWPLKTSNGDMVILVSADAGGQIVVWDVFNASVLRVLSDGNKPIQDLLWTHTFDQSEKHVLAIHPPHSLVLWDVTSGTKLWKKSYTEQLMAMDSDPFNPCRLAFVCPDCILLVEDFNFTKVPSSNGRKFYISSPRASTPMTPVTPTVPMASDRSRDRLRKLMRDIIVGEAAPRSPEEQASTSLNECLQLSFHRCMRHIICLVYAREVLLVDLRIQHTVAVLASTERTYAPLQQLLLCRQRDVLLCVHESGSISARVRRKVHAPESANSPQSSWNAPDLDVELHYDQHCQTDSIRLTKHNRVLAASLHPLLETRAALLLTDGRLYVYDLYDSEQAIKGNQILKDMISALWSSQSSNGTAPLKFLLSGLLPSLSIPPAAAVVKMCPPLTVKNWQQYQPVVAVGCHNGQVQIIDVTSGLVRKELAVHNYPVKGIEWTQLNEFLSYAQTPTTGPLVRNELALTHVRTGRTVMVRADRGDESSIDMVRVSPLKQYFIVVFKDSPPELWDLRHLTLVRTLPKRFPVITTLEWLPSHLQRHVKKSLSNDDSDSGASAALPSLSVKEFFVFSDPDGNFYHLTVEGSVVKDGARLSPPSNLNGIVAMAWKSDFMALGDAEGAVSIWEWKSRHFRPLPHLRSPIKKVRFAPGKNNMKLLVLHMDGVDIWDVKDSERLGQWRNSTFRDHLMVLDADWSASDGPLLACSDGTLRIFDLTLQKCNSPLMNYTKDSVPRIPCLMPRTTFQAIKSGLQLNIRDKSALTGEHSSHVMEFLKNVPSAGLDRAEQALQAAYLTGDAVQTDFWQVASFYLNFYSSTESPDRLQPLDTVHDLLCDPSTYRQMCVERAALYQSKPRAYEQTRQLTRDHLLLNDKDKAIALLLNTEPDHDHFYSNHLLACLAAVLQPAGCQGNAHSTIKLVATHLIASGHVWQGIEILILNGQVLDACRYLQANSLWEDSARVAKLLLMNKDGPEGKVSVEAFEIWQKWAQHLSASRQKMTATLILTAVGAWHRAAELLVQQQMHDTAALLLKSAQDRGVYEPKDANQVNFMQGVYCQYARLLYSAGWRSAAQEWAHWGGSAGQQLVDEWQILNVDGV